MRFNQQTDQASPRYFGKSALGLFIALICMLFAAGCSGGGGGNSGFVASPTGNLGAGGGGSVGNGSVTFNFVKMQSAIVVATNTTNLRFQFFTGLDSTGVVVLNQTRPFAAQVTFDSVPTSARSVKITALTTEGYPLTEFKANLQVTAGQNSTVSGTDGTTTPVTVQSATASPSPVSLAIGGSSQVIVDVTFSNSDVVRLGGALTSEIAFTTSDSGVATVAANGTITGVSNGGANIVGNITDFPGTSVTIPVTVGNGIVAPPTVTALSVSTASTGTLTAGQIISKPVGTITDPLVVTATFLNGNSRVVTAADGLVFTSNNPKFTVTSNQEVAVAADATVGSTATIVARVGGASFNFSVTASDKVLSAITVNPSSLSLPFGGFEQTFTVTGQFSDNSSQSVNPANVVVTGSSPTFTLDGTTLKIVTAGSGTPGVTNLTVGVTGIPGSTAQPVIFPVTVGQITVDSLTVTPSPLTLTPGQIQEFNVLANLSNSTQIDVSKFAALVITAVNPNLPTVNIVAKGRQVVGVGAGTASVRIDFGNAPTFVVPVTVQPETLVSVQYQFAGNPIQNQTVNLPRGYVGIVEVIGTFNTGTVRPLRFNEYNLTLSADNSNDPDNQISLFNDSYAIQPIRSRYTDGNMYDFSDNAANPAAVNPNEPLAATKDADGNDIGGTIATADDLLGSAGAVSIGARVARPVGSAHPVLAGNVTGSDAFVVATRDTFRGIAAGWGRGETHAYNDPFGNQAPVDTLGLIAPGAQRFFTVSISPTIVNPGLPSFDQEISVTISDPRQVSFASAGFVNYPNQTQTPTGSVREFEVRVNFSAVTANDTSDEDEPSIGPFVEAFTNFKLAEANVNVSSNEGGVNTFSVNTPTSLGFVGVSSDVPVDVNTLVIYARPLAGFGIRPVAVTPASRAPGVNGAPDTYTEGTYTVVERVFGPAFTVEQREPAGRSTVHDPGPSIPDAATQGVRAPNDSYVINATRLTNSIQFIRPVLFSVDPINPGGVTNELSVAIGDSQIFRTLVQFTSGQAPVDRSRDYPPILVANVAAPGVSSFGDTATGNLRVSGINTAGAAVTGADVTTTTGFPNLQTAMDVANALAANAQGIVIALDSSGEPIEDVGSWTGTVFDLLMQQGPAQSVSTINAVP